MTQQQFWDHFYAWCLGLGFVLLIVLIAFIWNSVYEHNLTNPFGPFIRAYESRRKHQQEIERIKLRADLARDGLDPGYIRFLEEELNKDK
jgi:hypothetical protein